MSSYHSSFSYLGKNSADLGYIIVAFDADNGEHDTFLGMDQIYTESYNGTKRNLYGSKYNSVAAIDITFIKKDGSDFTMDENRMLLRWLTGRQTASWLDFYVGDTVVYSFYGSVSSVSQRKLDARVIGMKVHFESIHPWAYSSMQTFNCHFGQAALQINDEGYIFKGSEESSLLEIDEEGILYNDSGTFTVTFSQEEDGTAYSDTAVNLNINNETDDLYTYINLDVTLENDNSTELTVTNTYLSPETGENISEKTEIYGLKTNEVVTLSAGQFIISDVPNKIFGDNFNFVWPRLAPGENYITVDGLGKGHVYFSYRYPIKIGDCAIDIDNLIN